MKKNVNLLLVIVGLLMAYTGIAQPAWTPVIYPGSATSIGKVTINGSPAAPGDFVGAFVGAECRDTSKVIFIGVESWFSLTISIAGADTVTFKIWQASTQAIFDVPGSWPAMVNGNIGTFPNPLLLNVVNSSPLNISIAENNPILCPGGNGGELEVSVSGGLTPYTISWSNGASGLVNANLPAGTYTVTVSDVGTGWETAMYTLTEPAQMQVSLSSSNTSSASASTGSVSSSVSGGTQSYTYLWSTGATTPDVSGLPVGNYCVTVTDGNGCTASACADVLSGPHFTTVFPGNGYLPSLIIVSSVSLDAANIPAGTEIAVFDGDLCVGFETYTGSYDVYIGCGMDDPFTTGVVDGFTIGNEITYKLWDPVAQAEVSYVTPTYIFGSGIFSLQGTAIVTLDALSLIEQCIPLTIGWNIISFNAEPIDMNMQSIFQELIADGTLYKVQDEGTGILQDLGGTWLNTIGNMDVREGYYVNVLTADTLCVTGVPVELPVDIPLTNGWNIVGFPAMNPIGAAQILDSLTTNNLLDKLHDETGTKIVQNIGGTWLNTVNNLLPGEGYYIRVNADCNLKIEEGTKSTYSYGQPSGKSEKYQSGFMGNPFRPMAIVITENSLAELQVGDELGVFDGVHCAGSAVFDGTLPFVVACGTDDPVTENVDGFEDGNEIGLRIWRPTENREIRNLDVVFDREFDNDFKSQGTAVVNITLNEELTGLNDCYPNPFSNSLTVSFSIDNEDHVRIEIYNSIGQIETVLHNGVLPAGIHALTWKPSNEKANKNGVYIVKMYYHEQSFVDRIVKMN